jgi:hypothetical protein
MLVGAGGAEHRSPTRARSATDTTARQNLAGTRSRSWQLRVDRPAHPAPARARPSKHVARVSRSGSRALRWSSWTSGPTKGITPVVDVVDSWTGRRNTALFEGVLQVDQDRTRADQRPRARSKPSSAMSRAVRSLHPRSRSAPRSGAPTGTRPFWPRQRLRHWIKAYQAAHARGRVSRRSCSRSAAVDEVAFAVPAGVDDPLLWVPPGYRLGAGYGEVKHKELLVGRENR